MGQEVHRQRLIRRTQLLGNLIVAELNPASFDFNVSLLEQQLMIDWPTAKIDRKLRTLQLQMAKAKLDYQIAKDAGRDASKSNSPVDGQGIVLDRNELLRQILNNQQTQK